MVRFLIIAMLLCAVPCQAGYSVFTRDQITPASIIVHGVDGPESRKNPGLEPVYPVTYRRQICRAKNLYSATAADRAEVWEDTAGVDTSAKLMAACPQIKAQKEDQIRAVGERRLKALVTPYLPAERETWHVQKTEAAAWKKDNAAPVPMLTEMAGNRGITVAELAGLVLENVALFEAASGTVLGQQQFLLDWLEREQDFATIVSITWE